MANVVPVDGVAAPGARFIAGRGFLAGQVRIGDDFEFTDAELDEFLTPP